jgi:hypothetical protein
MESPKLPRAVFTYETPNDRITTRMLMDETRTVVDNIIDNDPHATVLLVFAGPLRPHNIRRNKWESVIGDRHIL